MPTHATPEHDLQQQHDAPQFMQNTPTLEPLVSQELQAGQRQEKGFTAWRNAGKIGGTIYAKQGEEIHSYNLNAPLMLGNVTDWQKVLEKGDANFKTYLFTFLLLATEPSLAGGGADAFANVLTPYFKQHGARIITEQQMYEEKSSSGAESIIRTLLFGSSIDTHLIKGFSNSISQVPGEYEIMNFMMALYTNDGKLDLPKATSWDIALGKGNSLLEKVAQSLTNDKLATLIARYQGKVIEEKSRITGNSTFTRKSITKLGNETNEKHFSTVPSEVAQNMVFSALATALSASKVMLGNIISGKYDADKDRVTYNMVTNAAKIAGDAMKSYDGVITRTNDQLKAMFGFAWGAMPQPQLYYTAIKAAWQSVENIAKNSLQTSFTNKYGNTNGAKDWQDEVANDYKSHLEIMIQLLVNKPELKDKQQLLMQSYKSMDTAFRTYINQK